MNFLIDAQLPPALTRLIASFGHHAVHVEDAQLLLANDTAIWVYAVSHQHVIITKDEDFNSYSPLNAPLPLCGSESAIARMPHWPSGFNHSFLKYSNTFSRVSTSLNCIDR